MTKRSKVIVLFLLFFVVVYPVLVLPLLWTSLPQDIQRGAAAIIGHLLSAIYCVTLLRCDLHSQRPEYTSSRFYFLLSLGPPFFAHRLFRGELTTLLAFYGAVVMAGLVLMTFTVSYT